jgi:acyl transferase domain-containing protein/SAM-dependent methyltransferase/NADP-dependent 3-hydroxy acid dehydrogenase YdfG/acyl carrier protein
MSASGNDAQMHALLKQSLGMIEKLERELAELRQSGAPRATQPVAIIGLGCRLPGAADPAAFWNLLESGNDAIAPIPADRWDAAALAESERGTPGRIASPLGGYVPHLREFDADFFGIAPKEAASLDPQQRLLLEVAWEAIEHAGLDANALRDSRTGVFVGICGNDYQHLLMQRALADIDAYMCSGTCHSTAAGRLSYWLGLKGPSIALDTACSSSLVGLHLAARSIASGESDMALVGGVNRIISPQVHVNFSQARMLSPNGRCRAFDDGADGFVRAEGCGVVVLKRLDHAQRDGDRILAVVAGSAVNQDGRSSGLTVPNGPSQQAVIREAFADAGINLADADFIEAHGTGTSLGDPIEFESLTEVFGATHAQVPLAVGSVKTNVGHLEAAAGVASVIKVVLALQQGRLPGQLHFSQPSRHMDWSRAPLRVATAAQAWQGRSGRRVAGVSSFGFSGTNAHVVLSEAPPVPAQAAQAVMPVLAVSARSPQALATLANAYAQRLERGADVAALCAAAATRRTALPWRLAVAGADAQTLRDQLKAAAPPTQTVRRVARLGFVFSPAFTLRPVAAAQLAQALPAFAVQLRSVLALLPAQAEALRAALLDAGATLPDNLRRAASCALQLALLRCWRDCGVTPAAVCGQGAGELAAAVAAGVLDEAAALNLALTAQSAAPSKAPALAWIGARSAVRVAQCDAQYWNTLQDEQVDMAPALRQFATLDLDAAVEIGSGDALLAALAGVAALPGLASLGRDGQPLFAAGLAQAFALGASVNWRGYYGAAPVIDLPAHPYARQRHWADGLPEPAAAAADGLRFSLEWQAQAGFDAGTSVLPPLATLTANLGQGLAADREAQAALQRYRDFEAQLENVANDAIAALWQQAGLADGVAHDLDACCARLEALDKYRPLVARMAAILAGDGRLQAADGGWCSTPQFRRGPLLNEAVAALDTAHGARVETRLLARCAAGLADVVAGRTDPVSLLFPRGDFSDVAELYREGPVLRSLNRALCEGAVAAVQALQPGQGLRVVELGAGTGGTTLQLLDVLPAEKREYWFTDVGAAFVEEARRVHGQLPGLNFALVDVEQDAARTPIAPADLVVAANVLHATRDIEAAVRHAHARLKPGGCLLLLEGVQAQAWVDLTFGLTDGWWGCRADSRRPDYPLLGEAAWRELLQQAGFAAVYSYAPFDGAAQRLIVARRAADNAAPLQLAGRDAAFLRRIAAQAGRGVVEISENTQLDNAAPLVYALGAQPEATVEAVCADLLALARRLPADAAPLVLLADAATPPALADAAAALVRVLGLERGRAGTRRIHLDSSGDATLRAALGEIGSSAARDLRWSDSGREVLRLKPHTAALPPPPQLAAQATYLVTGGLGGTGLVVTPWLADCGARRLVLAGRSGAETDAQRAMLAALQARGVEVDIRILDLADAAATKALIDACNADAARPLRGVLHLAGVIGASLPAVDVGAAELRAVLAPKALGALHLHQACAGLALDFFVLFSSGSAAWGFKGQAHYAAANGFLDGLARQRRAQGLAACAIDWGYLAPGGMTRDADSAATLRRFGVHALQAQDILAVVGEAMSGGLPRIVAARNDWRVLRELFATSSEEALFDALQGEAKATTAREEKNAAAPAVATLAERLAGLPPGKRAPALSDQLAQELAGVLGRADAASIRSDEGFQAQGVDSLMALDLRTRIERLSGCSLPATMIYEFPDLRALSAHLLGRLFPNATAAAAAQQPAAPVAAAATAARDNTTASTATLKELEDLLELELERLQR